MTSITSHGFSLSKLSSTAAPTRNNASCFNVSFSSKAVGSCSMQNLSCRFGRFKSFVISVLEFFAGQNLDNNLPPKTILKAMFLIWGQSDNPPTPTGLSKLDPLWIHGALILLRHPSQQKQTKDTWDWAANFLWKIGILFLRTQLFLSQSENTSKYKGVQPQNYGFPLKPLLIP